METYKAVLIVISALMVELGGGEDLYWKPNSNWGNPDNWALGRAPSCGDIASFKTVRISLGTVCSPTSVHYFLFIP